MAKQIEEGTKKTILFLMGVLLEVLSLMYYNSYQIPAIIGIFLGIFFIVKSLS
jgi:hypothetical protein